LQIIKQTNKSVRQAFGYCLGFLGLMALLPACAPTRNITGEEYLLSRNRIVVEGAGPGPHQLRSYIRQQPNRRILGFYRFHLNVYQLAGENPQRGFSRWLKNTIGEPPVILERALLEQSERQLLLYMQNKGYFNANVDHHIHTRGKRARVTYTVTGNTPYTIRCIEYLIGDDHLAGFVYADTVNSLFGRGQRYDADLLQQERQRLGRHLRDQGFFAFSRDQIFFRVDSTLSSRQVDLEVVVGNPAEGPSAEGGQKGPALHRRYKISNIYVIPSYSRLLPEPVFPDTTHYLAGNGENGPVYTFLHNGPLRIRPKTLANNILLEQGRYFSLTDLEQTHNYLAGLRNFRFVNVQFSETPGIPAPEDAPIAHLDARVELTRAPSNAFTIEAEGLNSSGMLGVGGNLLFQNRNLFRGAEILNIRFLGALEVSGADQDVFQRLPFNTVEVGAEVSIDFPKLLFPVPMERLSRTARPKSTLLAGINYRQRPDYTRYILNMSYGFQWSQDSRQRHQLTPLEISSIKILNDSVLQSRIPDANPLILSRYKDHLIGGMKYSYLYSSQHLGRLQDFVYFRGNFETAGNLLYLGAAILNAPGGENQARTLMGIPYAQFVRADADIRYYRVFDKDNSLVFRLMGGAGIPYGNLDVMPFVKSFYGGGANGVRAWSIYNLGPGGYLDAEALRFDKYGDIKLEANIEYRFPVYRYWKGAFFADAGNVWFLQENEQFPRGEFSPQRFYKEIAIGLGAGIRLDFDFFLVRLDAAFPARNPGSPSGQRWIQQWPAFSQWNLNLGIGYPF